MVLGNIIQINAKGTEDIYLYGNPQVTYFKEVHKRATNFAINYTRVPYTGSSLVNFGSEITVNIPNKGDLLAGVYLKFNFSDLLRSTDYTQDDGTTTRSPFYTSYVNGIGFQCIDTIRLYINGQLIQTLDSHLIYLLNELHNSYTKKESFYRMTKFHKFSFLVNTTNQTDMNCMLLIPFFFSARSTQYLPVCALSHSDIQMRIKFKPLERCITQVVNTEGLTDVGVDGYIVENGAISGPSGTVPFKNARYEEIVVGKIENLDVITENIFLDQNEKALFMNKELSYLIELYEIGNRQTIQNPVSSTSYYMDFNGKHPTKYIMWYLQREDVFNDNQTENHTYSHDTRYGNGIYLYRQDEHIIKDAVILVNNTELVNNVDAIFLSDVQMYQRFNTSSNSLLYLYSFALDPLALEPTGTINLSKIHNKTIKIDLVDESKYTNDTYTGTLTDQTAVPVKTNILFNHYSCYYNILLIRDGLCSLVYQ